MTFFYVFAATVIYLFLGMLTAMFHYKVIDDSIIDSDGDIIFAGCVVFLFPIYVAIVIFMFSVIGLGYIVKALTRRKCTSSEW